MSDKEKYEKIKEIMKSTRKQLKELHKDAGTFENPVDIDMVKTTKAMAYEKILEVLKGGKTNE